MKVKILIPVCAKGIALKAKQIASMPDEDAHCLIAINKAKQVSDSSKIDIDIDAEFQKVIKTSLNPTTNYMQR